MIRNGGSPIFWYYMPGSITFESILSIRALEWLVILVGCTTKGKHEWEQNNLNIHWSHYTHYNSRGQY